VAVVPYTESIFRLVTRLEPHRALACIELAQIKSCVEAIDVRAI